MSQVITRHGQIVLITTTSQLVVLETPILVAKVIEQKTIQVEHITMVEVNLSRRVVEEASITTIRKGTKLMFRSTIKVKIDHIINN